MKLLRRPCYNVARMGDCLHKRRLPFLFLAVVPVDDLDTWLLQRDLVRERWQIRRRSLRFRAWWVPDDDDPIDMPVVRLQEEGWDVHYAD